MLIIYMVGQLPVNGFKWTDTSETSALARNNIINEEFIKNYNENNDKIYIFEVDVKYPKRLHNSFVIYLTRKNM